MPVYSGEVTHVELAHWPLWWIVLFPFVGAVINAVFGRWLQRHPFMEHVKKPWHIGSPAVSFVAIGAMLLAFLVAVISVGQLIGLDPSERYIYTHAWQMIRIGSLDINFAFAMDPLSALMTLIITGVGTLIHIYSAAYMAEEPAYWRFFCYLNLFIFAMLLLVLGDNMIVMFFGWEGVGLCSYLLIGFWYKDYNKATAGMKAFVVNRVGDWGFVCGMALLFWGLGGAWLAASGTYMPDYEARFVPVQKLALDHDKPHDAGHGKPAEHSSFSLINTAHAQPGPAQPGHEDHAAPPRAPGASSAPRVPARQQPKVPFNRGPGSQGRKPPVIHSSSDTGTLTMTTHAGARVYFGVSTLDELYSRQRDAAHWKADIADNREPAVMPCSQTKAWDEPSGPQLSARCFAVSPFVRKRIRAGLNQLIIVPGGGAVVSSNDDQAAGFNMRVVKDHETVIAVVGPTLTFREIHDQLVIKDGQGKFFVKEHIANKSVWGIALLTVCCLLFFVGAMGKSAQIPLYVWLPDAMAGPTPVSALIHAATMVTAGVYMVARLNFLFGMSPTASGVIALVGAVTALFAATMGFFQYDIKKVLAYSTVSQLGFMFIGVGVGAYWVGVFHLMTHAFFKACLFLGSGSVIHGMHHLIHDDDGAQDMRNMGGLRAVMPDTAKTYWIACMAISAVPPGLAGFWSKDEILWQAFNTSHTGVVPGWLIYSIGLAAALGTSFYMWRSYYLTFEGKHAHRDIPTKVHESPKAMTLVLWALAILAAISGVIFGISSHFTGGVGAGLLPKHAWMDTWLHPVMAHTDATIGDAGYGFMYGLMALSVFGAIGAWGLAQRLYGADRPKNWEAIEKTRPGFLLLHNRYYVDEIYDATFVAAFHKLRLWCSEFDRWIVDGLVNGVGVASKGMSWLASVVDKYGVDGAVNFVAESTLKAGQKLRTVQTGRVQNYVYGILGGVAFLAIIQYFIE